MVWDMFLREVTRQNKNGTQVSYLQLAHNEWDPAAQASRTKVLHTFGRDDALDRGRDRAPGRVAVTAARPHRLARAGRDPAGDAGLSIRESRPLGGA